MKQMTYKKKPHHDLHLWPYSALIGFLTFICSIGPKANSSEQQLKKNEGMCTFDKRNQEMKKKEYVFPTRVFSSRKYCFFLRSNFDPQRVCSSQGSTNKSRNKVK
ncbi:hypothetical protein CEXT_8991 [Caerostris extrusa]|uniref:Uncharacterized protein n=1 Tax=Caerostris extrusa TaxID=172846 RepID=A0AAV4PJ01_CAEEX|nr:hypothetical protein CEXT_8991 [Caerostris extrusa]